LVPYVWFLVRGQLRGALAGKVFGFFVLGGLQGAMGWYMVKSGLVDDPQTGQLRLGRFGWKANQPDLRQQTLGAFNGDMGITSSLFPQGDCTAAQAECRGAAGGGDPELRPDFGDAVVSYARTLAVPARRGWRDPDGTSTLWRGLVMLIAGAKELSVPPAQFLAEVRGRCAQPGSTT
jgi:hypothetical protein